MKGIVLHKSIKENTDAHAYCDKSHWGLDATNLLPKLLMTLHRFEYCFVKRLVARSVTSGL